MEVPKVKNASFKGDESEEIGETIEKYTPLKDKYGSIEELSNAVLEDDSVFQRFQESLPKSRLSDNDLCQILEEHLKPSHILKRVRITYNVLAHTCDVLLENDLKGNQKSWMVPREDVIALHQGMVRENIKELKREIG